MALNVNINVGSQGLIDANKLQATANREAKVVEKLNKNNTESEAQSKREIELQSRGQNPDGSIRKKSNTKIEPLEEEGFAWRSGGDLVLDLNTPPIVIDQGEWEIPDIENPRTLGPTHYFIFKDFKNRSSPSQLQLDRRVYMIYRPYRQWSGCTSYAEDNVTYGKGFITLSGTSPWEGGDIPRLTGCSITGGSELFDRAWVEENIYNRPLTDEEWDSILAGGSSLAVYNPRDEALGCDSTQTFYGLNCFSTGLQVEPVYELPTTFGNTVPANNDTLLSEFYKSSGLSSFNFTIEAILQTFSGPPQEEGSYSRLESIRMGFGDIEIEFNDYAFFTIGSRILFRNSAGSQSEAEIPTLPSDFSEATHFALVGKKNPEETFGTLSLFLDGQKIHVSEPSVEQSVYFNEIQYSGLGLYGAMSILGLRISKKSRYQDDFIPPTQLK